MSFKRDPKFDEAARMYDAGMSVQNVADFYGVTRQSMWKSLKRRTTLRPQLRFGADNHFTREGVTPKDRAHNLCEQAMKRRVIVAQPCEVCGFAGKAKDGRNLVQAHHDDYNKPLEVRWLCQKHHHEWHKHNLPIPFSEGD